MINGNLAECYFSEVVCAGGKWSSPCEIGSRKSSADQPVRLFREDKLWTLPGDSTLYCTSLMGLASHRSSVFKLEIMISVSRTEKKKVWGCMKMIWVESCINIFFGASLYTDRMVSHNNKVKIQTLSNTE